MRSTLDGAVLTIVVLALSLAFLSSPWNVVVPAVVAALDLAETGLFLWWSQRRKASVGVETLVGRRAVAVGRLRPAGQVKLDGELWEARSASPVERGQEVVVHAVDGLVLDVAPSSPPPGPDG
jgi:membrane-bound serine protease (ClpP class)